MGDMLGCSKFILWDSASSSLITVKSFHQGARLQALAGLQPQSLNLDRKKIPQV
jgi:hypothetical protein